ncbi:MAG: aminoglycoside phosphotransferase family protein [Anaerolineae bacterium]|nr:aminoglycoside phosphotransferase family protein [Anaerolineae bacterium]
MTDQHLRPLLDHLTAAPPTSESYWQDWSIRPVRGGMNSLLYRITGPAGDFAVKLSIRDDRSRALREYRALRFLREQGLSIAPEAVFLDTDTYPQQVIVQTWLAGRVEAAPPTDDAEWEALLRHYATIHRLTPGLDMPPAVVNFASAQAGLIHLEDQVARLPKPPAELNDLLQRLQQDTYPRWPEQSPRLVRTDPNTLNFIRRDTGWVSVDWENSGFGDPTFEIADMMVHPQYIPVPESRWTWVVERYGVLTGNPQAAERIAVYYRILAVWWVARIARYLYEIPRGLDPRLAERPPEWEAETRLKYTHYVQLAESLL